MTMQGPDHNGKYRKEHDEDKTLQTQAMLVGQSSRAQAKIPMHQSESVQRKVTGKARQTVWRARGCPTR